MRMKKFIPLLLGLVMMTFTGGLASAQVPVPDTIYKWVQSSPRANYYFNMEQLCFAVDEKGFIDRILTTNLVYQTPDLLQRPYYINVDMSKYIALIIDNLNHDASLSELLTPTSRINRLLEQYRS